MSYFRRDQYFYILQKNYVQRECCGYTGGIRRPRPGYHGRRRTAQDQGLDQGK